MSLYLKCLILALEMRGEGCLERSGNDIDYLKKIERQAVLRVLRWILIRNPSRKMIRRLLHRLEVEDALKIFECIN